MTITSNVTDVICYNQSVELTCCASGVNVMERKWISAKLKEPERTASIIVTATDNPVEYTCMVTDTNNDSGYSSVNISSNGKLTCTCVQ